MSSIPEIAKLVTMSIIDELVSELIVIPEERLARWESIKHFLETLPPKLRGEKEEHYLLATILTAVTSWEPYDMTYKDDGQGEEHADLYTSLPAPPLVHWKKHHWEQLSDLIISLRKQLKAVEDGKLEFVLKAIKLHGLLAPIRVTLESELGQKNSGPVNIHRDLVNQFSKELSGVDDDDLAQDLKILLVPVTTRSTRNVRGEDKISLLPIQDLKPIFNEGKYYSLHTLQGKISSLVFKWASKYMDSLQDYLQGNEDSRNNQSKEFAVKPRKVRNGRTKEVLEKNDGVFDDAEEAKVAGKEETEDDDGNTSKQSTFQNANVIRHDTAAEAEGVQILDDDDNDDDDDVTHKEQTRGKKRKKQRLFTQEEKDAIKDAVQKVGITSWAAVKDVHRSILSTRLPRTIKGCYKTMVKNGEIVEETDSETEEGASRKKRKKVAEVRQSPPPKSMSRHRVAKKWTELEKDAIRRGVYDKYHPGAWAKIKDDEEFREILANRTSGQIKDCYRTMCKNGEINRYR